jgi:hypothetical protein
VDIEGDPVSEEHASISWVPLDELLGYALAPSDQRLAEHLWQRRQDCL